MGSFQLRRYMARRRGGDGIIKPICKVSEFMPRGRLEGGSLNYRRRCVWGAPPPFQNHYVIAAVTGRCVHPVPKLHVIAPPPPLLLPRRVSPQIKIRTDGSCMSGPPPPSARPVSRPSEKADVILLRPPTRARRASV